MMKGAIPTFSSPVTASFALTGVFTLHFGNAGECRKRKSGDEQKGKPFHRTPPEDWPADSA